MPIRTGWWRGPAKCHDNIIETFQGHVVTEDAIKEWK